jgi:hypothetical protein
LPECVRERARARGGAWAEGALGLSLATLHCGCAVRESALKAGCVGLGACPRLLRLCGPGCMQFGARSFLHYSRMSLVLGLPVYSRRVCGCPCAAALLGASITRDAASAGGGLGSCLPALCGVVGGVRPSCMSLVNSWGHESSQGLGHRRHCSFRWHSGHRGGRSCAWCTRWSTFASVRVSGLSATVPRLGCSIHVGGASRY